MCAIVLGAGDGVIYGRRITTYFNFSDAENRTGKGRRLVFGVEKFRDEKSLRSFMSGP